MTVIVLHKIEKTSTHCRFHPSAPNHWVNIIFVKPLTAICREQSIVKHCKLWDRLSLTSLIACNFEVRKASWLASIFRDKKTKS